MSEREIEAWMGRALRSMGCLWYKWVSPGVRGVPDRILITPEGQVYFVELKADDGRLSRMQSLQIERLMAHGQRVYVVRGMAGAEAFVEMLEDEGNVTSSGAARHLPLKGKAFGDDEGGDER